jgi:hypothetical protein
MHNADFHDVIVFCWSIAKIVTLSQTLAPATMHNADSHDVIAFVVVGIAQKA